MTPKGAITMVSDKALREHLLDLLRGGNAHLHFDQAVADLPARLRGAHPAHVPHTPWRLVEHMRIAQWDILEFSRSPNHVSPEWPDGYWPSGDAPPDDAAWEQSLAQFRADLEAMCDLVADPRIDLLARTTMRTTSANWSRCAERLGLGLTRSSGIHPNCLPGLN
jgi:hypothetical protein